jgi:hypothetical protein
VAFRAHVPPAPSCAMACRAPRNSCLRRFSASGILKHASFLRLCHESAIDLPQRTHLAR